MARNVDAFFRARTFPVRNDEEVTLVTHGSAKYLPQLLNLTQIWGGPISASIFLTHDDFYPTLQIISAIMKCNSHIVEKVSLHLVTPFTDILMNFPTSFLRIGCNDIRSATQKYLTSSENYEIQKVEYPNNLLRNVGLSVCSNGFVFVVDIDMLPSQGLHEQFQRMITMKPFQRLQKFAYVVPAFEASIQGIFANKSDLLVLVRKGLARPFYKYLCDKCQGATNYEKWINLENKANLDGAYEVSWRPSWEPFYILPWNAPKYDERFKQYGFNRISHTCEVFLSGYRFIVLNQAFLIHDGFKSEQKFHYNKKNDEIKNRLNYNLFLRSLNQKYPQSPMKCNI